MGKLAEAFDELLLPWKVDLIDRASVSEAFVRSSTSTRFCRIPSRYSIGTPGNCLAVRMVRLVLTLATLGAGVSLLVRNS